VSGVAQVAVPGTARAELDAHQLDHLNHYRGHFAPELPVDQAYCEKFSALNMSEGSVKALITGILDKTGFDSIMKFSVYAVAHGFIVPDNDG